MCIYIIIIIIIIIKRKKRKNKKLNFQKWLKNKLEKKRRLLRIQLLDIFLHLLFFPSKIIKIIIIKVNVSLSLQVIYLKNSLDYLPKSFIKHSKLVFEKLNQKKSRIFIFKSHFICLYTNTFREDFFRLCVLQTAS